MALNTRRLIADSHGRITLWQSPNVLLWGWIILEVIKMFLSNGRLKTGFEQLGTATLFAWAYFEITKGVNYFRKALGAVVLIVIAFGFFR